MLAAAVVGSAVGVDFVEDAEVLAAEGGVQWVVRLLDDHPDFLGPGMTDKRAAEQSLELRPVPVGGDGEMNADDPATLFDKFQNERVERSWSNLVFYH